MSIVIVIRHSRLQIPVKTKCIDEKLKDVVAIQRGLLQLLPLVVLEARPQIRRLPVEHEPALSMLEGKVGDTCKIALESPLLELVEVLRIAFRYGLRGVSSDRGCNGPWRDVTNGYHETPLSHRAIRLERRKSGAGEG